MAIICHDIKLLFIMVPGTGCSVVGKSLIDEFGGQYLPEHDIVQAGKLVHGRKHNTVRQLLADHLIDHETLNSYLVVATVRNPLDRWVTYYQRLVGDWTAYSEDVQLRQIQKRREKLSDAEYDVLLAYHKRKVLRHRLRQRVCNAIGFNNWLMGTMIRFAAGEAAKRNGASRRRDFLFPMLDGVNVAIRSECLESGVNEVLLALGVEKEVHLPRKNVTPGKRHYTSYYSGLSRALVQRAFKETLAAFDYSVGPDDYSRSLIWLSQPVAERLNVRQEQ